ncbi:MAG: hypothetical protein IKK09_03485 [Clostridia bacterium]|nr:hypothetical protein [Clostridia bacterium]
MKNIFRPSEIPALSTPVTSSNIRNARNHPAVSLGRCTPFQLFESTGVSPNGTVCIIGNPARGIGTAKALIRRSRKPFLFLGTATDCNSAFASLDPEWTISSAQETLPRGNGAIYFNKPYTSYMEICEYIEGWAQDHFIIMHLGSGLQTGAELMNILNAAGQVLLFCESVPQSLRSSDMRTMTPLEFMKQMHYLLVFSSGVETGELIQLLPKYQYERVTNTTGVNTFKSKSFFLPFHSHHGHGLSANQSRTLEFNKNVFEMDDLQRIFGAGYMLVYNAGQNAVFVAQLI